MVLPTAEGSESEVKVWLLGRFAVQRGESLIPATQWRRRRPADVLKTLALSPDHALHREELIDRIWPDKDLESGANNLHRALHDLRRIVGPATAVLDKGVVRLAAGVWVDVTEFERSVTRSDRESLARAIDLYRGDLCPDDPYADELDARRESLRQQFVDAGLKLAGQLHQADELQRAIDALRRVVDVDPVQEVAHRMLMQALVDVGRRNDALRQFSSCVKALRERLDVGPSLETVQARDVIARGATPADAVAPEPEPEASPVAVPPSTSNVEPSTPPSSGQPHAATGGSSVDDEATASEAIRRLVGPEMPAQLRGRREQIEALEQFVERGTGVLVITGEAGVGKSTLAAHAVRLAASRAGARVLAGAGVDLADPAPFMPFIQAWTSYAAQAQIATEQIPFLSFTRNPSVSMQDNKLRLFQLAEQSLRDIGGDRPVVLALESLHLFDESSLHLLHYLARQTVEQRLVLVLTCRYEELRVGSPLQALVSGLQRERLGVRLDLQRLDKQGTRQQIADVLGREPSQRLVDTIFTLTAGNAFFTEEVARSLEGAADGTPEVPSGLREMIQDRVARLGTSAERLLLTASTVGLNFSFDVACRAAGQSQDEALDALDLGLQARLVEEHDRGYRFHHALVRDALYGALSRARRVHLHREVAAALAEQSPVSHEQLAFHLRAGNQPREALPHLLAAGERAAEQLGLRESLRFYRQALDAMDSLGTTASAERFDLLSRLGQVSLVLSELDSAVEYFDAAAQLRGSDWRPTPTELARTRRRAALALISAGDMVRAGERLESAMSQLEQVEQTDPEWADTLYHLAQLRWHQGRHREAFQVAERCLQAAEALDDPEAIARGYEMLALACHSLGEWKQGAAFEEKRQDVAGGQLDVAQAFDVHL